MAVGGSPAAKPISRAAMAKRVSESSTSNTFLPCAAKNSATVAAASAALMRISGDWSEVETTTTERVRPSTPSESSRNSPTSRPRSPTRPTTVTSASVLRVIMPINVLLPTPDPPKMPTRWPRPTVNMASSTRMPVPSGVRMGARSSGERTAPSRGRSTETAGGRPASIGAPSAFSTLPISAGPTSISGLTPRAATGSPRRMPSVVSTGMESTFEPRKPMTSARCGRPNWSCISQHSPTEASGPADSMVWPTDSTTCPRQRQGWPRPSRPK